MSGYSRQKLIMPKITRSLTMKRRSLDEQNLYSGKDIKFFKDNKRINIQFNSDNFKKPGTSLEKVKPNNIFPKIGTMKIPSSTACNILLEDNFISKYASKYNRINVIKRPINEINKEEYISNFQKSNTITKLSRLIGF